jgi:hypothetical protein
MFENVMMKKKYISHITIIIIIFLMKSTSINCDLVGC